MQSTMASTAPTVAVEKALFSSPAANPSAASAAAAPLPSASRPANATQPSLPPTRTTTTVPAATAAAGGAPPASAAAAPPVPALPADCTARVGAVMADDMRQLSRDDLDVKRWLNATLSRVLEAAKDVAPTPADAAKSPAQATRRTLQVEEQLVQLLYARVQTHSQELSASIEDVISNTLVRLPRTTMELARMSSEAEELTGQLQSIESAVRPAVEARSDGYVTQLHMKKASEEKLRTCMRLLEKAALVEETIRNIQYLVDHREARSASKEKSGASADASAATATKQQQQLEERSGSTSNGGKEATRQRDLDEVAGMIRQAREDLKEITAVDDTFGESYTSQLEQFELYIEHALEEECVACLRAHQLERATRLIATLHRIGRADAVLKRYGEQAAAQMAEQQEAKLRSAAAAAAGGGGGGSRNTASAAAAVADLLAKEIIPDDSAFLSQELVFLSRLVRGAESGRREKDTAGAAGAGETAFAAPSRSGNNNNSSSSSSNPNTSSGNSSGNEEDHRAAQVLEVLAVLLSKLYAPVHATMKPLLTERPDTTNADCVACFTAIQQLKVTPAAAAAAAAATLPPAASTSTTAKDPVEKLAREVTHRALTLFASLFQESAVLERYADRACTPVQAYCARPLAQLLPSSSAAAASSGGDEDTLAHVLTQAAQEVLVYVPDKTSARCTAAWHAQLSTTFVRQLEPTAQTSQHLLLQHLYLYKHRVRPLLLKTQQAVEDWLSSGATHARYPTSAGLLRADLQARLWTPLKAEVEAAQRTTQAGILQGITRPILDKVSGYATLPCWGHLPTAHTEAAGGCVVSDASAATARKAGSYTPGQVAPSASIRDLCELLMELPLTLETLASTAVADGYHNRSSSSSGPVLLALDAETEEGVRRLIDEQAEEWLESVVQHVVRSFLDDKVLTLSVGPFVASLSPSPSSPPSPSHATGSAAATTEQRDAAVQQCAMALEQLTTDLDYLRNILSAVNEESQETVERVMEALRALSPTARLPFVVGEAIHMRSVEAAESGDAAAVEASSGV